jgi:hypothetical protein
MTEFQFRLIISGPFHPLVTDEELLDATDALGEAGCDDASVSVHARGLELEFDRQHQSLHEAIVSAIHDVEKAGYRVECVEMERDSLIGAQSG